jgi:hypothetical protein
MRTGGHGSIASVQTTAGRIELPAVCRDASLLAQVFSIEASVARTALEIDTVEPAIWWRKALALFVAFEYRDTSIGPYNEVGVAILAKRAGTAAKAWQAAIRPKYELSAGWFIVRLPVTTEIARAAGFEIWGYPKYVADIRTEFTKRSVRVELVGELAIEHQSGWGITLPAAPFATLSLAEGQLIHSLIKTERRVRLGRGRTNTRIIGPGPTADLVRRLGLESLTPLVTLRTDTLQTRLPKGRTVDVRRG